MDPPKPTLNPPYSLHLYHPYQMLLSLHTPLPNVTARYHTQLPRWLCHIQVASTTLLLRGLWKASICRQKLGILRKLRWSYIDWLSIGYISIDYQSIVHWLIVNRSYSNRLHSLDCNMIISIDCISNDCQLIVYRLIENRLYSNWLSLVV